MDFYETGERVDAEVGERHDAVVTWAIGPDQAVLGVHFGGDVPHPVVLHGRLQKESPRQNRIGGRHFWSWS